MERKKEKPIDHHYDHRSCTMTREIEKKRDKDALQLVLNWQLLIVF